MNLSLTTIDHSAFILKKGFQEIASIKYNQQSRSIRIHGTQRRLFFLSEAGFLHTKIHFTTEYGVEIGENSHIRNQHKGVLHLVDKKFYYNLSGSGIEILDRSKKVIAKCAFEGGEKLDNFEISALVFSLTWLFNSSYKETLKEAIPVA
ncbi:MAG TPA: hypothetical protein VGD17_16955 [Chitinophagaceae bacterium]